jgi:hypothetical protein
MAFSPDTQMPRTDSHTDLLCTQISAFLKQNPADKQYMPQKLPQLKTAAANMCYSQPG